MRTLAQVQDQDADLYCHSWKSAFDKRKNQLSRLISRARAGDEIIITRNGIPIARLVAVEPKTVIRKLGIDSDSIKMADDFDEPLPDDILAGFLGTEKSGKP